MLTIGQIKKKGTWVQPYPVRLSREGCFLLPPIKLRCITYGLLPVISKGEILTIFGIDEAGSKPGTVNFQEKPGWWLAEHFELVTQAPISS